ncbi:MULTISPECIES: Stf0 family sulfotransferase [unclassified Mesorhizobium]|nr:MULTISPECIES: Stf0 family sulfotransferase [unclassified Mesorhizobium]
MRRLGVQAPDAGDIRPGVARLADETSLDWMRRYHLDAASEASTV